MVSLLVCPFLYQSLTPAHLLYHSFPRLHNNYVHRYSFWKDHFAHATLGADPRWRSHPHLWDHWLTRLAFFPTEIQVVEFEGTDYTCDDGIVDAGVWLSWIPACIKRQRPVWRVDYTRRDVWACCIFRFVLLCLLYHVTHS
jgi:hypothetical protein